MGVVGQGHAIAGLAAAYALPPSALPPSIPPRTPNHEYQSYQSNYQNYSSNYDYGPPRTPGDGGGIEGHQLGVGSSSQMPSCFGSSSSHSHHHKLSSSYNYAGGGQYAKYGKRY
jgi:hypothetical protein